MDPRNCLHRQPSRLSQALDIIIPASIRCLPYRTFSIQSRKSWNDTSSTNPRSLFSFHFWLLSDDDWALNYSEKYLLKFLTSHVIATTRPIEVFILTTFTIVRRRQKWHAIHFNFIHVPLESHFRNPFKINHNFSQSTSFKVLT